ncbi:Na+/H+ antiporter, partial [Salmonella enterica subsp. enterica]|nr:Na+/H+ antiporter [Salmonella enterica subsp. enterica]
ADAAGAFLWAVLGGALCGFLVLWASVRVMKLLIRLPVGAAETQVLLVIVMPFLAYLLAEYMGASGVLAAVVMGLLIGRAGLFQQLGVTARMLSSSTWNIISFALNGAIFVFLGMQLPVIIRNVPSQLMAGHWLFGPIVIILVLTLCLMALRFIFLVLADAIGKQLDRWQGVTNPKVSLRIKLCGAVAGVRGAVTLAGVLSLPLVMNDGSPFPARDLVIFLAAGVILCWLFIATAVLPGLARGLDVSSRRKTSLELRRARIGAAQAAIAQLQASSQINGANERMTPGQAMAASLIADYQRRIDLLEDGGSVLKEAAEMHKARADLQRAAIEAEIAAVRTML